MTSTTTETATPTKEPVSDEVDSTLLEPEPESTKVDSNESDVPQNNLSPDCYENGYESINPYLNPYTPVYYYPMPFYPVPGMKFVFIFKK